MRRASGGGGFGGRRGFRRGGVRFWGVPGGVVRGHLELEDRFGGVRMSVGSVGDEFLGGMIPVSLVRKECPEMEQVGAAELQKGRYTKQQEPLR